MPANVKMTTRQCPLDIYFGWRDPKTMKQPELTKRRAGEFSEDVWVEVLRSVDQTYKELVENQIELEKRNTELEAMRTFMTSITEAMTDVLVVCGMEGQVLEVNQALLNLSAFDKDEILGAPLFSAFADDDAAALKKDFASLRNGNPIKHVERLLKTCDGPTPLDLSITARIDARGRYIGAVLIGRPVGELRRAYQEMEASHNALMEAQSQLVHSEKLASLGRLLAGVAHELNNPISFVYGNTHALERYSEKFERYFEQVESGASREELIALRRELKLDRAVRQIRSAVSGALEGAERVRDIVESLRRLSADGDGTIETFDLVETTSTAASWVIKGRASTIPVEMDAPGEALTFGRTGHIQQVIMNLVQNALDALEDVADPRIDLIIKREDGETVLDVLDNGPGVPEEIALKIFDPFFTTKPVGKGTGLGLSISYKIVDENGGTLSVSNRPEGGARFRLTLPAATGAKNVGDEA